MSRIVLVNPNMMKPAIAPIGLDYLADALAAEGHEVAILDLCFSDDWRADVESFFASNPCDLAGVTIRNTDDCYFASRDFFIPFIKEVVERIRLGTDAPVVLGGAGLSVAAEAILEFTGADYALIGEGEVSLPLLAEASDRSDRSDQSDQSDQSDIPGLVYRDGGILRSNLPAWCDVSRLPARTRKWLDNRRYFAEGGQAGIETKRGCEGKCIYCADPVGKGASCRLRPPALVVAEIRGLLDQGIDCFHLCDAEFNIPIAHAEAVCREIISSGIAGRFRWYTYASPAPFTDELADLMIRAGCVGVDFGADSGDDGVLRSLGRDFNAEDVRRTAEICRARGIVFMYDLLIGGPGESRESVKRTIEMMKAVEPDRVGVSMGVRIYGGTALGRMVRREGFSRQNPALYGEIEGNESFLRPVYYISPAVGIEVVDYISELIGGDRRFFHASRAEIEGNYNYNDNAPLVEAIKSGHRGAYWDILRRLQDSLPPSVNP